MTADAEGAAERVTVAIPLHRGERWVDVVVGNIARLAGHADIVVSDLHEHDGALAAVRSRTGHMPGVVHIGARDVPAGWAPHYNDLLRRAATPLFMWLPQDDEIGADWIGAGREALRSDPGAVLATGALRAVDEDGCLHAGLHVAMSPRFAEGNRDERLAAAAEYLVRDWAVMGTPFRGVFRRAVAPPVPEGHDGEWADLLWLTTMLARGPFVAMPEAVYRKRFRSGTAHGWWSPPARSARTVDALAATVAGSVGDDAHEAALRALWRGDRAALRSLLTDAEGVAATLEEGLRRERAAVAAAEGRRADAERLLAEREARLGAELAEQRMRAEAAERAHAAVARELDRAVRSISWRATAPLRRLAAVARRPPRG